MRLNAVHTLAMTTRSARLLAICLAISIGEVSQAVPWRVEPSGMVIVMGTRGCANVNHNDWVSLGRPHNIRTHQSL